MLPPMGWTTFALSNPKEVGEAKECAPMKWTPDLGRQLGGINDQVNFDITADNRTWGSPWKILPKTGCCHDYAVSKRHLLLAAGWPASCLLLAEVKIAVHVEDHLILICRTDKSDIVLDNETPALMSWPVDGYGMVRMQSKQDPNVWLPPAP